MSSMLNESDFEASLREAMHSLANAHEPMPDGPTFARSADTRQRRTWLMAAASLLVLGGASAVLFVASRDTSPARVVTEPVVTEPVVTEPVVTERPRASQV